jgi:SAM-dependent methyltransferase
MVRHFGMVAARYRELRDLDVRVVRRVSLELAQLSGAGCRLAVLDVGAGTGRYTEAVLQGAGVHLGLCYHAVAYDAVPEMLSSGTAHRAWGFASIDCVIGLAELLPFPTHAFDTVLSFNAVHHFNLQAFLAEAARVLRPNGRLIIYTRTPEQNQRTIWGQLFPHFAERETRLYAEGTLRTALDAVNDLESLELLEIPSTLHTSLPRLLDQARSSGYSTFRFYAPEEFKGALGAFEARVRSSFDNPFAITAPNDHLLVLATRHGSTAPATQTPA